MTAKSLAIYVVLICIAAARIAVAAESCSIVSQRPSSAQLILSRDLYNPKDFVLSQTFSETASGRDIYVNVSTLGNYSGLVMFHPSLPKTKHRVICSGQAAMSAGDTYQFYFENLWDEIALNVGLTPGTKVKMDIYTGGRAANVSGRSEVPQKVKIPIEVFVLYDAPLADVARSQVDAAAATWSEAGVIFDTKFTRLTAAETDKAIGASRTIGTYYGCVLRFDEPGYSQREKLAKLKSDVRAIGVFYVKTTTQSQAEREFNQVYMFNDPSAVQGRTLAHEIGHLLLGEGHVGGQRSIAPCTHPEIQLKQPAPWTSGLMEASPSNSVHISDSDAKVARGTAIAHPRATWW